VHAARRVDLLGCPLDLYSSEELLNELDEAIRRKAGAHVIHFVNANKIAKAHEDTAMRNILWRGDYVLADGQPLLPMGRLLGVHIPERIDGIGLMQKLLALANANRYGVFLLGARQDVLEKCLGMIRESYPEVLIVGSRNGYFRPDEVPAVVADIKAAQPAIVFIGIGSPIKEELADTWKEHFGAAVIQGVGGSFDVLAGLVSRAPLWMQRAGLEWLFRVWQEPRRMFWRYARTNAQCLWLFASALTSYWRGRLSRALSVTTDRP